ncbi:MAG TPA: ATP-binding protein, partial [Verrucomicrobiae bacterium]|nr:ATP-binding protein [Verrucomicrobiae bacterium]
FLNFARPQPLQLDQVDLLELVHDCQTELSPLFNERKVELLIENPSGPIQVAADERMLRQTLLNLMRNAAEAIPEANDRRRVAVGVSRASEDGNDYAVVTVQDSGPGIPTAQLQKIFIPFFTTKATGHGIGLALAHRVVSQHGGELTVANNNGARFTLRLPVQSV